MEHVIMFHCISGKPYFSRFSAEFVSNLLLVQSEIVRNQGKKKYVFLTTSKGLLLPLTVPKFCGCKPCFQHPLICDP